MSSYFFVTRRPRRVGGRFNIVVTGRHHRRTPLCTNICLSSIVHCGNISDSIVLEDRFGPLTSKTTMMSKCASSWSRVELESDFLSDVVDTIVILQYVCNLTVAWLYIVKNSLIFFEYVLIF